MWRSQGSRLAATIAMRARVPAKMSAGNRLGGCFRLGFRVSRECKASAKEGRVPLHGQPDN